jgi:hypothetical protein
MSAYAERAGPAAVADAVACVWSTVATGAGPILPDACVDLMWMDDAGAFVAGPDTAPGPTATGLVTGVRLRTGHAAAVLGVPADELRDRRVPLEDLWGRGGAELAARLEEAPSVATRQALLAAATLARVLRFQRLLALAQRDGASLADLALNAGYADQPHMTGEVTRITGAPPTDVLGVASPRGDWSLVRSLQDAGARAV